MGKATVALLRDKGHRVIGVDLKDAEIVADLGSVEGRAFLIAEAARLAPDGLDGVVAGAGVAMAPDEVVLCVNYFGAVATLEGLRPLLARSRSPRAVLIASTAAFLPYDEEVADKLLAGDQSAISAMAEGPQGTAYATSKNAVARWLRRAAISPEWAGAGILLNAIGPGRVRTAMIEPILATEEGRAALALATPLAVDRPYGEPQDIAEVIAFLLEVESSFLVGQVIYVDGGTDAIMRPGHV